MTKKHLAYVIFVALGLGVFAICTVGFDVHARMTVGAETYEHALSEHLHYAGVGSVLLSLPFIALGAGAAVFFTRKSAAYGIIVFLIGVAILAFLYYRGYISSQVAMSNKRWTAAALSVGLLPFESFGVLIVLLGGALIAARRKG
jgi:uncharacterized membrane-anchored protein